MEDSQINYYIRPKTTGFNVTHLITFLWNGDLNCYYYNNSTTGDEEDWTRLILVHSEDLNQWIKIVQLQAHPQILQIQSGLRFLAARTANFVANRTFGTVSRQLTGGWRNPKMLHKDMGSFDVEVAARHYVFLYDDAKQPAYARAHRYSKYHRRELFASDICGCFYCTATFTAQEIQDWIHEWDGVGLTALCPSVALIQ